MKSNENIHNDTQDLETASQETKIPTPTPKELEEGEIPDQAKPEEQEQTADNNQQNEKGEIIVNWDGPDDPMNPRNWSPRKKWAAVGVVSSYTFLSPIASSMVAPAAESLGHDLHITSTVLLSMLVSIFVLAYAFGPLILGPLSEIFGRARVLQIANLLFLVFNIACGFAQNSQQFLAFRFLAGFGGSAPLSIGGGVLGDCFIPDERGRAVALYSLAPILGPAIGPVAGGFIAENTTWRWVFWSSSFACCVVQIIGLFALQETFHPVLLEQKAKRIRKEKGYDPKDNSVIRTVYDSPDRHWQEILSRSLVRPFRLFLFEPIIQLLGLYMAFIEIAMASHFIVFIRTEIKSLVLVTIPGIFQNIYKENVGIAGLHYIALGIGLTLGSQGLLLIGLGMMPIFQNVQNYVIDAFTLYAASALASVAFLRSLAGFGFPLFAPTMYNALGYGKGNTILAVCAIVIGWPATLGFWLYGEKIRKRSRYAS
ncbi:hypothetical protein Clacol_008468 [Clathrus columnatus]|uniref:Major facilitator superfamily (MFS) profile domain-containing protein n=1 Tax=Clathrus columnatus TaxID=1419009 RepID=A0AAV5AHU5_9AGAM|nr:hypothetical protein Clacol_008468 [Clathrus columnatus]